MAFPNSREFPVLIPGNFGNGNDRESRAPGKRAPGNEFPTPYPEMSIGDLNSVANAPAHYG